MKTNYPFTISDKLCLRDPEQTLLGKKLVECAISLIDQLGLEHLTFRKLAQAVPTTEASIYRYFEDKYQLLGYLVAWYWEWLNYRLQAELELLPTDAHLPRALEILANSALYDPFFAHIDEAALCRIVIRESPKIYLTGSPTAGEKPEFFHGYQKLCEQLKKIFLAIHPGYTQPLALANTLIVTAHRQILFSQYLPMLTELKSGEGNFSEVASFLETLALGLLRITQPA